LAQKHRSKLGTSLDLRTRPSTANGARIIAPGGTIGHLQRDVGTHV